MIKNKTENKENNKTESNEINKQKVVSKTSIIPNFTVVLNKEKFNIRIARESLHFELRQSL